MGYETRMYVVERKGIDGESCLIDGKIHRCYPKKEKDGSILHVYYPDGNVRLTAPPDSPILNGPWCEEIAMLNLCVAGTWPGICDFKDSDGCYIYGEDGDSLLGLDSYGSYRSFVHIDEVLTRLKKERKKEHYRRFSVAIALLTSIRANFVSDLKNIGCLFYGY